MTDARKFPVNGETSDANRSVAMPSVAALVAGWFTYGPISELIGIKGAGHGDELIALSAGLTAAVIAGAYNSISIACSKNASYRSRRLHGAGWGAAIGAGTTATVAGFVMPLLADLATTGGVLTSLSVLFGGTALGAKAGDLAAKSKAKKQCRNDHWGDCCERMCLQCGFIFTPNAEWRGIFREEQAKKFSDRLEFYDVVSILHYRGFNYIEVCGVLGRCGGAWEIDPKEPLKGNTRSPTIGRTAFFSWFEENEPTLSKFQKSEVSDDIWNVAEFYVRSDCKPNSKIELSDLSDNAVTNVTRESKSRLTVFGT